MSTKLCYNNGKWYVKGIMLIEVCYITLNSYITNYIMLVELRYVNGYIIITEINRIMLN